MAQRRRNDQVFVPRPPELDNHHVEDWLTEAEIASAIDAGCADAYRARTRWNVNYDPHNYIFDSLVNVARYNWWRARGAWDQQFRAAAGADPPFRALESPRWRDAPAFKARVALAWASWPGQSGRTP